MMRGQEEKRRFVKVILEKLHYKKDGKLIKMIFVILDYADLSYGENCVQTVNYL